MQNNKIVDNLDELIEKAKNGDVHAFGKIVKYHQSYAYALAFRFMCDEHDAEDVVQESFMKIWSHLKDFDMKMKFTTWMYKIVVNLCYDKTKFNKKRNRIFERLNAATSEVNYADSTNMEEMVSDRETVEFIKIFANGLSEKQRMIFLLRDMQDLTVREVVDITGMSESTIKTNLFFARQNIRKKLAAFEVIV